MFSIIMPVWNRAGFVKNAIESVLAQTFQDYELLIIDDASKGNLAEVVQPYLSEKIIYHRIPHSGISAARNFGIENSTHPFIAYLDSDNRWHHDFLVRMRGALQSEPSREIAYCMADRYRKDTVTGRITKDGTIGEPFSFRKLMKRNYIDINTFVHSRKALEFVGQFDTKLKRLEDWDLIIRMTSLFEPVFVSEVLADYYSGIVVNIPSVIENLGKSSINVRIKHAGFREPVVFVHDAIEYMWENLPEKKYLNWVHVHHKQLNTSDYTAWGYPFMLQIEPTNVCNLKCPLCPAGLGKLGRKARHMSLNDFKGIIDDMESYLMFLVLWDWGEPFTNPDFPEMIRYASERDIRTVTSTNAQFLKDRAYIEAILKSGLSTLIVAVDSACEHGYEAYRRGGHLDAVLSGLQQLTETKKRIGSDTLINMRMVMMKSNEHELPEIRRLARRLGVDWFSVKTAHINYDDNTPDSEVVARDPKYRFYAYKPGTYERIPIKVTCRKCWEMASIFSNGDVVPCCYDYNGTLKLGNVFEQPLTKLWNCPIYREFRRKVHYQKHSMPICKDCETNYELSETGWFAESHHMGYVKQLQAYFRKPLGRRILKTAKKHLNKIRCISD